MGMMKMMKMTKKMMIKDVKNASCIPCGSFFLKKFSCDAIIPSPHALTL